MKSIIEAKGITKRFGKVVAVNRVNYSASRGINMILGPNGAGKSTLLKCIDGLYRVDSGTVRVLGEDPYLRDDIKFKLSLLSDHYALYDFLSVMDNLIFFGRLYGLSDKRTAERSKEVLKDLDAIKYLDYKVNQLSRGTQQKIAFCRSVLSEPEVLLLDEPTAFLDAGAAESVRRILLKYVNEGKTILFVTQKLDEITRLSGKISILRSGKIIKETTTEGLYSVVLKNSHINVRVAKPLDIKTAEKIEGFSETNRMATTVLRFRIDNYKEINRIIMDLTDTGAYIVSVDYVEPFIEDLVM